MKRIMTFLFTLSLLIGITSLGASTAFAEDTVEVTKDGAEFDPKVDKSKLPDGAWYCDMGGVHYARMDKGDGKCELCGMKLHQKEEGKAGHSHGHDGHQH